MVELEEVKHNRMMALTRERIVKGYGIYDDALKALAEVTDLDDKARERGARLLGEMVEDVVVNRCITGS